MKNFLALSIMLVWAGLAQGIELIDSGILFGEFPRLYWMDNERVIFQAASGERCNGLENYKRPLSRLAIYDIGTRKTEWYGPLGVQGLCYDKENIAYWVQKQSAGSCPEAKYDTYAGKLGKEALIDLPKDTWIDPHTCTAIGPLPDWLKSKGKRFERLRPEHGYLELDTYQREGNWYPVRIHPSGNAETKPIDLPDVFKGMLAGGNFVNVVGGLKYFAFRQAYLIRSEYKSIQVPDGIQLKLWWLHVDGQVEEIASYARTKEWPYTWVPHMYPYKNGLVFKGAERKITPLIGQSGLYRYYPNKPPERIVPGRLAESFEVSPDGCKIAFGNDDRERKDLKPSPDQFKLQIVDLCKGEKP